MDDIKLKAAVHELEMAKSHLEEVMNGIRNTGERRRDLSAEESQAFIRASFECHTAQLNLHGLLLESLVQRVATLEKKPGASPPGPKPNA